MTTKNEFHDEEYQFPQDDDYSADLQAEQPLPVDVEDKPLVDAEPKSSGFASVWETHKRTITIVGVVAVVAVVFAVMRVMHKPATPIAPPVQTAPAVVQQPVVDPQMAQQLASLKEDAMNNATVVRQLQGQVQQLTGALNQTRAQQQQLNQNVMVLVSQMQQLTTQVQKLAEPPKPVKVAPAAPKAAPVPVITYQLRAVVPGRAWIVASDGQSQSVAVGDHVQQYGAVQSIDADSGVVITTSGKTIKF